LIWQKILTYLLVSIMCLFFLLYVGMEVSYGLFIATFSVESQLNLSKSDGAYITAIFWGCFAAMRFVAIFAAVKLRPIYIMVVSFVFCLLGAIPLVIWAETSPMLLKVTSHMHNFTLRAMQIIRDILGRGLTECHIYFFIFWNTVFNANESWKFCVTERLDF
jgi:hypothetical protein